MYLLLKAFHIISVVAWFAGLFYMFRLFVYHAENKDNPDNTKLLKLMAYRLFKYIMTPAMIGSLGLGIFMLIENPSLMQQGWIHIKFALLFGLFGYHGFIGYTRKRFANDDIFLTSKQCRWLNEVPTLFLISIILLAILKP